MHRVSIRSSSTLIPCTAAKGGEQVIDRVRGLPAPAEDTPGSTGIFWPALFSA